MQSNIKQHTVHTLTLSQDEIIAALRAHFKLNGFFENSKFQFVEDSDSVDYAIKCFVTTEYDQEINY